MLTIVRIALNYVKRIIGEEDDIIIRQRRFDTIFPFDLDDLASEVYCRNIVLQRTNRFY